MHVRVDRPPPGEELNEGTVSKPRLAASAIVLRDGSDGLEVLLVERNPESRFMGGAWVFPGGAFDEGESPEQCALRELEEEASLGLGGTDSLVPFSRWITPSQVKVRFDTYFFIAEEPEGADAKPDGHECTDLRWLGPAAALEAAQRDELLLVFPTIKHLEQLAAFNTVAEAFETAGRREVVPIEPRVVVHGDHAQVLLPGEPGYDD